MVPATIYTVHGPRGVYYAVHNHHTGKIWTERTELAAEEQAADEGLALIDSKEIDHASLLDLMIALAAHPPALAEKPAENSSDHRGRIGFHIGGLSRFWHRRRREAQAGH